jgi:hypothetical protein
MFHTDSSLKYFRFLFFDTVPTHSTQNKNILSIQTRAYIGLVLKLWHCNRVMMTEIQGNLVGVLARAPCQKLQDTNDNNPSYPRLLNKPYQIFR